MICPHCGEESYESKSVLLLGNGEYGTGELACQNCGGFFEAEEAGEKTVDGCLICPWCRKDSGQTEASLNEETFYNWAALEREECSWLKVLISLADPRGADIIIYLRENEQGEVELYIPEGGGLTYFPFKRAEMRGNTRVNIYGERQGGREVKE